MNHFYRGEEYVEGYAGASIFIKGSGIPTHTLAISYASTPTLLAPTITPISTVAVARYTDKALQRVN